MSNVGKSIVESFGFVSRVWSECENLANLLKQEVSSLINSDDEVSKLLRVDGSWIEEYNSDASGCIYTSAGHSLPIIVRPKKKVSRYLCLQISLSGDGLAAIDNSEPMIHVMWWAEPLHFEEGPWMGFPFDLDDEFRVSIDDGVLFRWPSTDVEGDEWAFSLRLTSINTPRDVEEKIVNPLRALLSGRAVKEALPLTIEGLVQYIAVDGELGNFRVKL